MFWGCFHCDIKGPGIFWEKDWGSINAESYCAHTIPIIHGYIELCRRDEIYLKLMQDGAPGHAAADTATDLQERGIEVIFWPAFSPDLNPIERVWHIMKNYLQDNFPEHMSYDRLRSAVKEAWEVIGQFEFRELGKVCRQGVRRSLMRTGFLQSIRYGNPRSGENASINYYWIATICMGILTLPWTHSAIAL